MKLNALAPAKGARKARFRVGRGIGSGWGKTSGRGENGQNSRSGGGKAVGFEGGQMPLAQRFPKRGFTNVFKVAYEVVNLKDLARFKAGTPVDPKSLYAEGLVKKDARVKVLGTGDAPQAMTVKAHKFSKSAVTKLTAAGGTIEVIA